ncbi:MAG: pyridoxamine 5'-phosphate oxidase family protein [Ruminococcaceae bacterium]|nr:pyridoxamine 5'-phosphate oxidase family protein [Oscillospiraceae bacterium]
MTRREREVTDISEKLAILDKCKVLHLGLVDGDEPYVVPMNYGYVYEDEKLTLYLHGAKRGRKIDLMQKNPKVFFEMDCDITPFEGEIACQYGITYASIMGRGVAEIVEDVEEKKKGMSVLMKTQTGKDFEFEDKMVAFVNVIKITASSFTAKRRPLPSNHNKK